MSTVPVYPTLVMIIRHGEKPGDPSNENNGGPDLSILGSARAAALPSLFTPNPNATTVTNLVQSSCAVAASSQPGQYSGTYGPSGINAGIPLLPVPDFLFATLRSSSDSSNRPVETITPLSQALALKIGQPYTDNHYSKLKSLILDNLDTYGGKVILICWHHGKIPDLAGKFGVPASQLAPWSPWPGTVFDLVFNITWDSNGNANLAVGYQQLLFGDTPVSTSGKS